MIELFNNNKRQTIVYLVIIVSLLLGVYISAIFTVMSMGLLVASMLFHRWDDLPVLFLLFSFANIMKLSPGTSSLFTFLCMIYVAIEIVRGRTIKPKAYFGPLVFFAYVIITDLAADIELPIKLIIGILFIYVYGQKREKNTITVSMLCYADGLILSLLLSRIPSFYDKVLPYMRIVYWKSGTDIQRSCGLFTDPNYCGMAIIMGIAVLTVLYKFGGASMGFWVRSGLLSALGLLTYSKSYIIMLVFAIVFLMVFVVLNRKSPAFLFAGVGVCVFSYYAMNGQIESINRVLYRFQAFDFTTGRIEKNVYYLQYIWNDIKVLFFGTGISIDRLPGYNNVHNFPIEAIQRIGLLGSTIYITVIARCSGIIKAKKRNITCYFPIIVMTLFYLSLAGLTAYEFPFYVALCITGLNYPYLNED